MAKTKSPRPTVGLAIGKNTHTVVFLNPKEGTTQMFISNSQTGLEKLQKALQLRGVKGIVMVGNRHFGAPLAYGLCKCGIEVLYYAPSNNAGKRGKVGSIASRIPKILQNPDSNFRPLFFNKNGPETQTEKLPSYRLALEYNRRTEELQGMILQLHDHLATLFPEIVPVQKTSIRQGETIIPLPVPQPKAPGLFTKKMRPVLENPNPRILEENEDIPLAVKELAARSLAKYIPAGIRKETEERYKRLLARYYRASKEKEMAIEALRKQIGYHPLVELFNNCNTIYVVLGFLGWRNWPNWRELRSFCGLAVTRIDNRGNPHIARKRPEIRKFLYLLAMRTSKGKGVIKDLQGKSHIKIKRVERILKYLRNNGLGEKTDQ